MAKQTFGIGGPWTGQIGKTYVGLKVVNGHAVRKYVKPANPKTSGQVAQRGKFALAGRLASLLKDTIVLTFWNPFAVNVYGVNNYTGVNTKSLIDDVDFSKVIMSKGGYEPVAFQTQPFYDEPAGNIIVTWLPGTISVGTPQDPIYAVTLDISDYDPPNDRFNLVAHIGSNKLRGDGSPTYTFTVGSGKVKENFVSYLMTRNPTTESKIKVSASVYSISA